MKTQVPEVLILAGGRGTRLGTITSRLPKPMVEVADRPFLEHLVVALVGVGLRSIILSVGWRKQHVIEHFGSGSKWQARIRYVIEARPLGTGGAVRAALDMVRSPDLLVMNGDTFPAASPQRLIAFRRRRQAAIAVGLVRRPDPERYGSVRLAGGNRVASFVEKARTQGGGSLVNSGTYALGPAALADLASMPARFSFERDFLPRWIGRGLLGLVTTARFVDMGTPEALATLRREPDILRSWSPPC